MANLHWVPAPPFFSQKVSVRLLPQLLVHLFFSNSFRIGPSFVSSACFLPIYVDLVRTSITLSTMGCIFHGVSPFSVIPSFLLVSPFWSGLASSRVAVPVLLFCGGYLTLGSRAGVSFSCSTLPLVAPSGGRPDRGLFDVTGRRRSVVLPTRQRAEEG